jgi:hypothetical protein
MIQREISERTVGRGRGTRGAGTRTVHVLCLGGGERRGTGRAGHGEDERELHTVTMVCEQGLSVPQNPAADQHVQQRPAHSPAHSTQHTAQSTDRAQAQAHSHSTAHSTQHTASHSVCGGLWAVPACGHDGCADFVFFLERDTLQLCATFLTKYNVPTLKKWTLSSKNLSKQNIACVVYDTCRSWGRNAPPIQEAVRHFHVPLACRKFWSCVGSWSQSTCLAA